RQQRFEAAASRLRLPTLLVRGGLSDVLTEEGARDFLAFAPHSEYVNVTNAGHMIAGDRNDIFGSAVIDFLNRVVPASGDQAAVPHDVARAQSPGEDLTDIP